MNPRLAALLHHVAPNVPTSAHLRIMAPFCDFEAYRNLARSITGTTWLASAEFAFPAGMTGRQWERETRRIWRRHQPLHLVIAGDVIASAATFGALRATLRP